MPRGVGAGEGDVVQDLRGLRGVVMGPGGFPGGGDPGSSDEGDGGGRAHGVQRPGVVRVERAAPALAKVAARRLSQSFESRACSGSGEAMASSRMVMR